MYIVRKALLEDDGYSTHYCRTIEKVREIFEQAFWDFVDYSEYSPEDLCVESWESYLEELWNEGGHEEIVYFRELICEEDK